jgi:hypothetical protein
MSFSKQAYILKPEEQVDLKLVEASLDIYTVKIHSIYRKFYKDSLPTMDMNAAVPGRPWYDF